MTAKLRKIYILFHFCCISGVFSTTKSLAQNCSQTLDFNFKVSTAGNGINFTQFPDFSLPFKIVYGGPNYFGNINKVLRSGFTHISNPNNLAVLSPNNRAFIFYNVASDTNAQPWRDHKSPWGNDINSYYTYWNNKIAYDTQFANGVMNTDILLFDIEQRQKINDSILVLKNVNSTPLAIKNLGNDDFVKQYKVDMQNLYVSSVNYIKNQSQFTGSAVGSYGDSPISNTFINIQGKSWSQWKTDKTALDYLNVDFNSNSVGGNFYNTQNLICPSAYFEYDYPHIFAGEYLAYLMFQIEANRAWSNKDIMLFEWQKFNNSTSNNIKPWMAEAMAIFPFMSGAKGIWLWEDPTKMPANADYSNYEYFTKGLYRLSKFKDVFNGSYQIIETISARDYDENKLPIWRGILNNNKLLVAAHNPWATDANTVVNLDIKYANIAKTITLTGYEVYLCEYDLSLPTGIEPINTTDFVVYPNPTTENLNLKFEVENLGKINLEITALNGKSLYNEQFENSDLNVIKTISLANIHENMVLVNVEVENKRFSRKVVLQK